MPGDECVYTTVPVTPGTPMRPARGYHSRAGHTTVTLAQAGSGLCVVWCAVKLAIGQLGAEHGALR